MENYGKTDIKNLMAEYERNLPLSSMAISYLFDVGVQKVKEVSPEEYAAGVDAAIAEAESCGSKYFLTRDAAIKLFELAKKYAEYDAVVLVAILGSTRTMRATYIQSRYGIAAEEVGVCPRCGCPASEMDEETDSEVDRVCCDCGNHYTIR